MTVFYTTFGQQSWNIIGKRTFVLADKSAFLLAEEVGFEPTCPLGQLDFESSSL